MTIQLEPIAITGQSATGTNGNYMSFGRPRLNEAGEVTFISETDDGTIADETRLQGGSVDNTNSYGIFTASNRGV